jgi:hypothetical protein
MDIVSAMALNNERMARICGYRLWYSEGNLITANTNDHQCGDISMLNDNDHDHQSSLNRCYIKNY